MGARSQEQFRIVSARVQNFGCFRDSTEVLIDEISALIAENENGKTTFLRSLAWWGQPETPFDEDDRWDEADKAAMLDLVSLTFDVPQSLALKLRSSGASKFPDKIRITRCSDSSYRVENAHDGLPIERVEVFHIPDEFTQNLQGLIEYLKPYKTQPEVAVVFDDLQNSNNGLLLSQDSQRIIKDVFPTRFNTEMLTHITATFASLATQPVIPAPVLSTVDFDSIKFLVPRIAYFDETTEFLEDSITYDLATSDPAQHRTMINLARLAGFDLLNVKGSTSQDRLMKGNHAEKLVSSKFNRYWQGADVNLLVHLDESQMTLMIEYKGRTQRPSRRSSGLKWQLGFYINFEAGCEDELSNAVLLLDEPGLRLHIKQQPKLLELFEKLAHDGNTIVYSTHLGNMLLGTRPHSYRLLVQDPSNERAVIIQSDVRKIKSSNDVLQPVRQALGMGIANSISLGGKTLLVEGLSDVYILSSMSELSRRLSASHLGGDVSLVPVGGSGNKSLPIVAFAISESATVVVLADNDKAGRSSQKTIRTRFRDMIPVLRVHRDSKTTDCELEDLFDADFYLDLVNEAHSYLEGYRPISSSEIREDISICDAIQEKFDEQGLGEFQKLRAALVLKTIITDRVFSAAELGGFPGLFIEIEESFRRAAYDSPYLDVSDAE